MTAQHARPLPTGRLAGLVTGAPVAVLGFGVSNRPLCALLARMGAELHIYDQKSPDALGQEAAADMQGVARF